MKVGYCMTLEDDSRGGVVLRNRCENGAAQDPSLQIQ